MEKLEISRLVTKILKFTNPQWKSLEISTFISQQFGNLQIQREKIWKFPDFLQKIWKSTNPQKKNLEFPDLQQRNLEFQIHYTKTWKLTNRN